MNAYNHFIIFCSELRHWLRFLGFLIITLSVTMLFHAAEVIGVMQGHLGEKLYFFSVAGPFLAHMKTAFFLAIYLLVPWILYVLWRAVAKPFGVPPRAVVWFMAASSLLFYAGTLFCYWVTLPYGVDFLLSFQSEELKPVISLTRFVNFVLLFILAFGVIFELPVVMVFSALVGVKRQVFERNRRYAVLVIAILAAMLTPTPDVVNMALMGGPLYLLYEAGILVIRWFQIDQRNLADPSHLDRLYPE